MENRIQTCIFGLTRHRKLRYTSTTMPVNLEHIRHSLAHLLAAAVLELWPDTKHAIGPAIEDGFYFDFEFTRNKLAYFEFGHPLAENDLLTIEAKMREILPLWKEFTREEISEKKARELYRDNRYKLDLIDEITAKKEPITLYHSRLNETATSYLDLCRGGHVRNTQDINPETFKLTRIAGAYWRGSEKNPMLTRIYGIAFATKEELEKYLWQQEEAKKRDHRILGERLKLFTFAPEVGPGLALWLPNGTILRDVIEERAKQVERARGYKRVSTPHIAKEDLFRMSGHIPYYADSMYPPMKLDDGNYYLKAMNCPHTHMIYRAHPHSYRELPIRYAEYGTVYRHELSGTLAGLLRVRGFTQNDAHIYCREDQVEEEFLNVMRLHEFWYKDVFGIKDFHMRLSLPAKDKKKYADVPEGWKKAEALIRSAMQKSGMPFEEAEGEAAFYGPKVDFQIKSAIGREETASTNQLDFLATKRFNLTYADSDGKQKPLYVIHRAPLGSHERFIAFLIEHYAGAFPFWLAPVQVALIPVSEKQNDYATKVLEALKSKNIRTEISRAEETLGKRIWEGELQKIPYILIVGAKEESHQTINIRSRDKEDMGEMSVEEFLDIARSEDRPTVTMPLSPKVKS